MRYFRIVCVVASEIGFKRNLIERLVLRLVFCWIMIIRLEKVNRK
ncbi:hypothetical protein Nizo2831_1314 [Lactiplantibacillus plantarum]|nr:hypothetical protein GBLP1_g1307 [Lactiplantibacillus plantarum]KZU63159.1 hypothetical protein Nizo2830_2314 [Lactiplantibacillus plantarum]KZU66612.1 hypothetical protein Nizo2831_1314 [Lactiplantibacillus plantarum]